MKKIIRLTESDLARIVKRVIKENEEDWVSQSEDMEGDSDFGKIDLEKKALKQAERATNILSDDEKNILIDFLNSVEPSEFQDLVSDEIENMGVGAITENEKNDLGMSEEEYQVRKIIDKVLRRVPVIATLGVVPAAMFVGGGLAIGLGVLGLAGMLLKDVAWWRPKGYDKDQSSIYHKAADRARYEDGEGRDPYINEMEDEEFMRGADKNWRDREYDDYKDRSMYSPYYGDEEDDEEWGETDRGEEELQDLIEEARDFLENECGYEIEELNSMSEDDIVEAVFDEGNVELAKKIDRLLDFEGFYNGEEEEGYEEEEEEEEEEELGEGWDDYIQKKRHPEKYKPEKYIKLPKNFFKSGHKIDKEGTYLSKNSGKPFDDYEELV